jgi:signal transduction histidine kinase
MIIENTNSAELLYKVSQQLNSSLDLDEVLGKVLRLTVEATGAKRGSFFLLDETGSVVQHISARPNQTSEVNRNTVNKVMAEGMAGWVYQHRQAVIVADTRQDERWVRLPNDEDIMGSALVIPLLYQDRVNGLLALHHKQIDFFDNTHLTLAIGIAGQAATAIENARLYTQVKSDHEALFALISGMPIPILVINQENITFKNRAAERLLLVKEVDIPVASITGGKELLMALEDMQQSNSRHVEVSWPDKRTFDVTVNKVPQYGTVVALHDITYLKELDEMKSLFVETVSHDLKSPLAAINGYATLMTFSQDLSERDRTNLDNILQTTIQMQQLIVNLLDLAEIESGMEGQIEPCHLAKIAADVLESYGLQIEEKEISLEVDFPDKLAPVNGDPMRLNQVISNYVSNALKYTPPGGQIIVKGCNQENKVHLEVSDTGPGIPPAAQTQLFQKFYRVPDDDTGQSVEGTGLGLSIVKAIIEGYGGKVWVKSEVGAGSTFGCTLPEADL